MAQEDVDKHICCDKQTNKHFQQFTSCNQKLISIFDQYTAAVKIVQYSECATWNLNAESYLFDGFISTSGPVSQLTALASD